jgi:hypothetical protein
LMNELRRANGIGGDDKLWKSSGGRGRLSERNQNPPAGWLIPIKP